MTYQFIPIFLVEFKFLLDFFIDDTKKVRNINKLAFLLIT